MASRFRRAVSVSYGDLFRPGPANTRVALYLFLVVGVMLSLWLYVWCVISCPRQVAYEVPLVSGESISVIYVDDDANTPWIEYVTNTDGTSEAVREEVKELLHALQASSRLSSNPKKLEFQAWRVDLRIWSWVGPLPDVRCCTRTIVLLDMENGEVHVVETPG